MIRWSIGLAAIAVDRLPARYRRAELRFAIGLRALPPRVAWFQWRARRLAWRTDEQFSLTSATRPYDLAVLLKLASGCRRVVEIGTGTAWTAISLALADPAREVISYDRAAFPEREGYLALVGPRVRSRIALITASGSTGPQGSDPVDLLYIDSSHQREETVAELRAWKPALRSGALVVFDDYLHPEFPGVREAVTELGLRGEVRGTLFVHHVEEGDHGRESHQRTAIRSTTKTSVSSGPITLPAPRLP